MANPHTLFGEVPLGTGYLNDTHSEMHGRSLQLQENAAAYGAHPDATGATNKTAIQDAVDALLASGTRFGRVFVPAGDYDVTGTITVGSNTENTNIELVGLPTFTGANSTLNACTLRQTSTSSDTLVLAAPENISHSITVSGISVVNPVASTKACIKLTGYHVGTTLQQVNTYQGAYGIQWKPNDAAYTPGFGSLSCAMRDITCYGATTANISFHDNGHNLLEATRVYAQSGTGVGVLVDTGASMSHPRFETMVIESNTGVGLQIDGHFNQPTFAECWWEGPGSDMIRITGGNLNQAVFLNPRFDGSSGAGGRNVINNTAAAGSSIVGRDITIIGGLVANLNGGKLFNITTDPSAANSPGYLNINIVGLSGSADIKGLHTDTTIASQLTVLNSPEYYGDTQIIVNGVVAKKARYIAMSGAQELRRNPLKIQSLLTTDNLFVIQAVTSQSGDLFRALDSSSNVLFRVAAGGNVVVDNADTGNALFFGSAADTNLFRRAANQLKTDDKLLAALGIGVGNSAAGSSLGTVTKKIEVFDASGVSLGFLPVYDAIT